MRVTVSTEASDSTSIAFSTVARSSLTRSKISLAVSACPARSVSIGTPSVTGLFWRRQTTRSNGARHPAKPLEVGRGNPADFFHGDPPHAGQHPRSLQHQGRLVAFAAMRNGGQPGGIGLDQQAVVRGEPEGFADGFGGLERRHAAKRQMETEGKRFFGLFRRAGETVHNAGQLSVFTPRVVMQDRHGVSPGFARMNNDRQPGIASDPELLHKDLALHGTRRKVVMVVEADFAERYNFWMGRQRPQLGIRFGRHLGGIVWMDANRRADLRIAFGEA